MRERFVFEIFPFVTTNLSRGSLPSSLKNMACGIIMAYLDRLAIGESKAGSTCDHESRAHGNLIVTLRIHVLTNHKTGAVYVIVVHACQGCGN